MKKITLYILTFAISFISFSQNAIVGPGFSTSWGGTCDENTDFNYLSESAGSSWILTENANGTGNQYFRFGVDFDGTIKQLTYIIGSDAELDLGTEYILDSNCTSSGAMFLNVTDTSHNYIFKTTEAGANPEGRFIVFSVQGDVRSVTSVSNSGAVYPGQSNTVTATLDGALANGQSVYLRYTDNSFTNSTVVEMTGSGTSYTAEIPALTNTPSANIKYYVFTSGNNLPLLSHNNADFYTINLNNNSGSLYSYTVESAYTTASDGSWDNGSTWTSGVVPPDNQYAIINHAVTIDSNVLRNFTTTINDSKSLTINNSNTLTISNGGIEGDGSLDVQGILKITDGGFTGIIPNYNTNSTLEYANITSGSYNRYNEWTTGTTVGSGVPDNVIIDNSTLDLSNPTGSTTDEDFNIGYNLTILNGGSLNIDPSKSLTVGNDLDVSGGTLELKSTSQNYSNLIVNGTSSGDVTYNRFTALSGSETGGTNDLVSPPVGGTYLTFTGQTFGTFATANNGALAFSGDIRAYAPFNKTTGTYVNYLTTTNSLTELEAGKGYRAGTTINGETLTYTGHVLTGDVNVAIESSGTTYTDWNLIGNPYPSYIKLSDFLSENAGNLLSGFGAVYGYDGDASDDWEVWDLTYSATNPDAVIAPGQGFFVASPVGGSTISFTTDTPDMRTTGSDDDFIAGRSDSNIAYANLNLDYDTNSFVTNIFFIEGTTQGLDQGYDTSAFNNDAAGIFTALVQNSNGEELVNQSLPYSDLNDVVIPVGVKVNAGIQSTISLNNTSTIPSDIFVYIEDNVENTWTLLNDSDYIFTPTINLTGTGRFFLHFTNTTLSNTDFNSSSLLIYANSSIKTIEVKGELFYNTQLHIYDIHGRLVLQQELDANTSSNSITTDSLHSGVYIVQLKNESQYKTQKLIIE